MNRMSPQAKTQERIALLNMQAQCKTDCPRKQGGAIGRGRAKTCFCRDIANICGVELPNAGDSSHAGCDETPLG